MTVQYGEDQATSPGYGLHPVLQRHLDDLNQHLQPTSAYGSQPFEQNPVQPPKPPEVTNPDHIPTMEPQTPNSTPTIAAQTATPQGQDAGQMPNQVSMAGSSAGGSADTAHTVAPNAGEAKPANIQMPGQQSAGAPQQNISTDDIDEMGRTANSNMSQLVAMHRAQQAQQGSSMYSPGQQASSGNIQLSNGPVNVPGFDGDQVNNARAIIQQGLSRGMSRQDIETAVMTGLTESSLRNINGGDRDSLGLFQQRPSQGWGSPDQIMDPNYAINKFYDTLAGTNHDGLTPWQAAQAVQRSAFSDGSNYQGNYDNAKRLVDALVQQQPQGRVAAPTMAPNGALNWISQNTNKYEDYDGWYGAQCVDLYDFYTTGFVGGQAPMVGYADEIWNNHDPGVYTQIDRSQPTQMGDVAVFGRGQYTPFSHVGIILGDNGDGTVKTLSNNATSAGSAGASAIVDISKASLIGYLRPNRLMGA